MANRLAAINQLQAKIISQGVADIDILAQRAAKVSNYANLKKTPAERFHRVLTPALLCCEFNTMVPVR